MTAYRQIGQIFQPSIHKQITRKFAFDRGMVSNASLFYLLLSKFFMLVGPTISAKLNHMTNPIYYDQICPNLPLIDPASEAIRDEFAKTLKEKWSNNNLHDIGYKTDDLAAMLAFSPYLQRLALRHHNDIRLNLLSPNFQQIKLAQVAFIDEMENADCDEAAMRAIRKWRERTALAIALGDIAGLHDMPTQMLWLSEAAQTVLTHTVGYLFRCAYKQGNIKFFAKDLTGCGWTVLALGKLGASELNFSSDVDLIALHDTNNAPLIAMMLFNHFCYNDTRPYSIIKLNNAGRHWLAG